MKNLKRKNDKIKKEKENSASNKNVLNATKGKKEKKNQIKIEKKNINNNQNINSQSKHIKMS